MGAGDFMPTGGGNHRKKRLSAAERKKVLASYKAVSHIQNRNSEMAEIEANLAEDLLKDYIHEPHDHAQNENHHNTGTSDGQPRTDRPSS